MLDPLTALVLLLILFGLLGLAEWGLPAESVEGTDTERDAATR